MTKTYAPRTYKRDAKTRYTCDPKGLLIKTREVFKSRRVGPMSYTSPITESYAPYTLQ